ncbi:MAG: proteasome activator [Actinomycetota bacterium]
MPQNDLPKESVAAEVVEGAPPEARAASYVQAPKLIRIASMTRAMLDEVRQAPIDEQGRRRLAEAYDRSLTEMQDVLSEDLRQELADIFTPICSETATESELRIAQAQLVGWLEGLFAGIQATLLHQQAAMASQLQEMRMRAIEAPPRPLGSDDRPPGQYL